MAASSGRALASSSASKKHRSVLFSLISVPHCTNIHFSRWSPQLGICKFSTWNGLRHVGVPTSRCIAKIERKRKCNGKVVLGSLFGTEAPEALVIGVGALVIGVVVLLVFGPKGIAEVARNIAKNLLGFQSTIKLKEVSREFKGTLQRETNLDEIQETTKSTSVTSPTAVSKESQKAISPREASLDEANAKTSDKQIEASAVTESTESQMEPKSQPQDASLTSKEAEIEEYLKRLDKKVQALIAKKQKNTAGAATEVKPQANTSSSTNEASSTEEFVEALEEQIEASASQQQKEKASMEGRVEPQKAETREYLKKLEEEALALLKKLEEEVLALLEQKRKKIAQAATNVKPQVTDDSPISKEADPQKYFEKLEEEVLALLKKLEDELLALLAQKQNQTAPTAAEAKPKILNSRICNTPLAQKPEK